LRHSIDDACAALQRRLHMGDPRSPSTAEFAQAMLVRLEADLSAQVDQCAAQVAGATGLPPGTVRSQMLHALGEQAAQLEAGELRRQLAGHLSETASELQQSLDGMSEGDVRLVISAAGDADAFALLSQQVRATYGSGGPSPLRPPHEVEAEARQLAHHLAGRLAGAFEHFGQPSAGHEPGLPAPLLHAAIVLADHGIGTPARADAFLSAVRMHDDCVAAGTGALAQLGYAAGMGAFMYFIAPAIAPALLGQAPGVGGAVALGAAGGALIGCLDSVAGSGASQVRQALSHAGSAPLFGQAAGLHFGAAREIATRAGIATGTTFAKNLLLRIVLPSVVYAALPSGVNRSLRDSIDFAGDAGGGLASGALAAVLIRRALDNRASNDCKLLSQQNLPQLVQARQQPAPWVRGRQAGIAYAQGLGSGLLAPSTWAITALLTPMVGILLGINIGAIPPGIGSAAEPGDGGEAPIHVAEHALKATVSTLLTSVIVAGASGIGQLVGRHADADLLAAIVTAARRATAKLRGDVHHAQESV
jgi:hypothetical protein